MKLSEILNQQEIAESYLTQIKSEVMNLLITLVANGQSEIETDKLVKQLNGKQEGFNVTANSIRDLLKDLKIVKSVNGQKVVLNTSNSLTQHSKDATMDNEKKVNKLAKKTIDRDL
tara:strand:+ start:34 stop:381 length:348 start_codon:yes stop_codon:yes gene_type:complete